MRALQVTDPDGPDSVLLTDVSPPLDDAPLVIDVHAAGVGFADLLMSRGEHQIRQEPPFTLGWEAAAVVVRAPSGSGLQPGDAGRDAHASAPSRSASPRCPRPRSASRPVSR